MALPEHHLLVYYSNREKPQLPEDSSEISPLFTLTNEEMLTILSCEGLCERFNMDTARIHSDMQSVVNPETKGLQFVETGNISDKKGKDYSIISTRDLDNRGMKIVDPDSNVPVIYVNFRDRLHDGTPEASPPRYLQTFEELSGYDLPERSYYIGGTNWYYSAAEHDWVEPGIQAVEVSIVSSDPEQFLLKKFTTDESLSANNIDPNTLATFVDNPFAQLPDSENESPEVLENWYKHFWTIVKKGLDGEKIPLPGQTSESGLKGFFYHVMKISENTLAQYGYTRLDAVPTWSYVRELFKKHDFAPSDDLKEARAERLSKLTKTMPLPEFAKEKYQVETLGDLAKVEGMTKQSKALEAWYQVLPFALVMHAKKYPSFKPSFMHPEDQASFSETLSIAYHQYSDAHDNIITYPLAPGKNFWYTKDIIKIDEN